LCRNDNALREILASLSRTDEFAVSAAPNVTDVTVQNQCPLDESDHLEIASDPVAMADMLNALDPAQPVKCPACSSCRCSARSARCRRSERRKHAEQLSPWPPLTASRRPSPR
jgi:hypothetical protein